MKIHLKCTLKFNNSTTYFQLLNLDKINLQTKSPTDINPSGFLNILIYRYYNNFSISAFSSAPKTLFAAIFPLLSKTIVKGIDSTPYLFAAFPSTSNT